ncbi:hypothetical protein AB0O47_32590 [Streptomyces noursei]|uniref:hypothetical protein n=1 Tax=Streptomyces TaxID=1883 RepID=UPI00345003C7
MPAPARPAGSGRPDDTSGRDWTRMKRSDFDRDAPLTLDVAMQGAVPAVPDDCGTPPLFGVDALPRPGRVAKRRPNPPVDQDGLF